jgi:two-component system, LytTR family, response regulator
MEKIKAIIIDDEAPARRIISEYLKEYIEIDIICECEDGFEGVKNILELRPDIIFLDIQMPRISGFELLELISGEITPLIIFTTAYDSYAIRSFDYNACDYLLKPIEKERFDMALHRAVEQFNNKKGSTQQLYRLVDEGMKRDGYIDRIVIRSGNQIDIVQSDDILYLEANDDYVIVHTGKGDWQKKQTLRFYENKLNPGEFVRVHRSFIVKVSAIKRIEPYSKDAFLAIISDGGKISVSKSGYSRLKELLGF